MACLYSPPFALNERAVTSTESGSFWSGVPGSDFARVGYTGEGGLDEASAEDLQIGKDSRISLRYLSQFDPATNKANVYVAVTGVLSAERFVQPDVDGKPVGVPRVRPGQEIAVCR
jgi:hypothetical protein